MNVCNVHWGVEGTTTTTSLSIQACTQCRLIFYMMPQRGSAHCSGHYGTCNCPKRGSLATAADCDANSCGLEALGDNFF
eukprot:2259633-Amphidinium_carterae.1